MDKRQELQAVIRGNNQFTKTLHDILSENEGNIFFSPISAHVVLAMIYQGARGSTYDALTSALAVHDSTQAAEGYNDVIKCLNNIPDIQLLMANKIYIMKDYILKSAMNEIASKNFLSEIEAVDFKDSKASADTINSWVEAKTQDKIKHLIKPSDLNSRTRLVLVNAIYFKGNWASKFNKFETRTEQFYLNDSDSININMMNKTGQYFYKEDQSLDAKILDIPYSNPDVSLIVILPNKRNGIAELERKLINTNLDTIAENMSQPTVIVKLPKFKIETAIELNEPLEKMGLGIIFNERAADFSNMLESIEPLVVSRVIQKAFIEVNEEGTEAAAATAVVMQNCMSIGFRPPPPKEFKADHPFIIYLRVKSEYSAPLVLFAGRISKLPDA